MRLQAPVPEPSGGNREAAGSSSRGPAVEQALASTIARYDAIIASAMDAIISIDAEHRIVLFNAAAEKMFGLAAVEALGQNLDRLIPERFRAAHQGQVRQFGERGQTVRRMGELGSIRALRANGEEFSAEASISQVEAGGEKVFTVIVRDVSERERAEATRARLAAIVESSEDAILSKTLDGVITSWNAGAERLLGYRAEEILGQPVNLLLPPGAQAQEDRILERLRRGERVEHYETVRRHQSGRLITVSLTISPIRNHAGEIIAASTIIRDITERIHAEAELRASESLAHERLLALTKAKAELETRVAERTAELRQRVAELQTFSHSLSHDLRAPLRAIQSFTHLALTDHGQALPAPAVDLLKRALSAAARMDRLVQEVLTLNSVSLQPVMLESVDLAQLLQELLRERPELQAPQAEVVVQSPLLPVRGHPALLAQAVTNLLSNAIKFVAPGVAPSVRIWTELARDGGTTEAPANGPPRVRLFFEDNGIGLPPEAAGRIFQIFQRFHQGFEGSGIGLAIVHKATERMGGHVGYWPAPGGGTRFWIALKAA